MDTAEIVKSASTYGAGFINTAITTLTQPRRIKDIPHVAERRFPLVIGYATASVLLGTGFQHIVLPDDPAVPDYVKAAFVVGAWLLYAVIAHALVLLLTWGRTHQPFLQTLLVTLTITSVLYVSCSFIHTLANIPRMPIELRFPHDSMRYVAWTYWELHLPLMAALSFFAVSQLHNLRGARAVAFGVLNTIVLVPFELMGLFVYMFSFGMGFA